MPKDQQVIALIDCDEATRSLLEQCNFEGRKLAFFKTSQDIAIQWKKQKSLNIVAVISQSEIMAPGGISFLHTLHQKRFPHVPFLLIAESLNADLKKLALRAGVTDIFLQPAKPSNIESRTNFLIDNWAALLGKQQDTATSSYHTPLLKRVFDIFFAGGALLLLSPFFLIIYLLIRLESKGPAFYYSLRVGTGYRVFRFYKFRSMYVDADKRLKELQHLNQYATVTVEEAAAHANSAYLCDECRRAGIKCQFPVYADDMRLCEKDYRDTQKSKAGSAFFKLKDDPRITRIGKFIRNTSIDELPQLWNVVIGDMSIVGNRPLPLYEAEKLTTDKYALRFIAPAGITGLWQVEKRGKGKMSEEERLLLDNMYAQNHSVWNDIKLIWKTIPALFQKENV